MARSPKSRAIAVIAGIGKANDLPRIDADGRGLGSWPTKYAVAATELVIAQRRRRGVTKGM